MTAPFTVTSEWAVRARRTLFGVDWTGPVVLTPIGALFRRLAEGGRAWGGWWPAAECGDLLVVHVPQGSPAADAVHALPPGTAVTFVGLAGGLHQQPPGTILRADRALHASGRDLAHQHDGARLDGLDATTAARRWPQAVVATVDCLATSNRWHDTLARVADCVDMETVHLFAAGVGPVRSLLVISDHNRDGAVFASDLSTLADRFDELCAEVTSTPVAAAAGAGRSDA